MKKRLLIISCLFYSLHGVCDEKTMDAINNMDGKDLDSFILSKGNEAFKEAFRLDRSLTDKEMKPWLDLTSCVDSWFVSGFLKKQPLLQKSYRAAQKTIIDTLNMMPNYSKNLYKTEDLAQIDKAINKIFALYSEYFKKLPQISKDNYPEEWKNRSVSDVLTQYKSLTGVSFDPNSFFNQFKKLKSTKNKLSPIEILKFIIDDKNIKKTLGGDVKSPTLVSGIRVFINMLEELSFQSKSSLWRYVPGSKALSQNQIDLAQEIVTAFYFLYPTMETKSVKFIIGKSDSSYKPELLVYAQAKVLLQALNFYFIKASKNIKK